MKKSVSLSSVNIALGTDIMKNIRLSLSKLICGLLFFTTGICTAQTVPDFVMPQAEEAFIRYLNWKGGEETLVFPILTDVHTGWYSDRGKAYRHLGYMAATDRLFGYDFMVNLGDIGLNGGEARNSSEAADKVVMQTRQQMELFPGVWIYTPGNHDWDGGAGRHYTSQFLSDAFQKPSEQYSEGNLHIAEGKAYGYYDLPEMHVRIIFLNSQGTETLGENYYTFDNEQLEWLIDVLKCTSKGTDILTFSHYMPHPIGRWMSVKDAKRPTCEVLCHLLADFVNRRKGGELGLEWNFKRSKGRLVGLLCGDTHCNRHIKDDGVNYYITQGLGFVDRGQMLPGQTHADYDLNASLCFDVIALKLKSKQVHSFRVGAGGKDYDLEFSY